MTVREEIKYALQESEMMNRGQSIDKIIEDASKIRLICECTSHLYLPFPVG